MNHGEVFHKVWLSRLIPAIKAVGGKRSEVLAHILKNMSQANQLTESVRDISRRTNSSTGTVSKALRELEAIGFIARKSNVVTVNPEAIWCGNPKGQHHCLKSIFQPSQK